MNQPKPAYLRKISARIDALEKQMKTRTSDESLGAVWHGLDMRLLAAERAVNTHDARLQDCDRRIGEVDEKATRIGACAAQAQANLCTDLVKVEKRVLAIEKAISGSTTTTIVADDGTQMTTELPLVMVPTAVLIARIEAQEKTIATVRDQLLHSVKREKVYEKQIEAYRARINDLQDRLNEINRRSAP